MLTVATVCEAGGSIHRDHAVAFVNAVKRFLVKHEASLVIYGNIAMRVPVIDTSLFTSLRKRWNKLLLFHPEIGQKSETFYLDVTTLITGELDSIIDACTENKFYALRGRSRRPDGSWRIDTSMMYWKKDYSKIWEFFEANKSRIDMTKDLDSVIQAALDPDEIAYFDLPFNKVAHAVDVAPYIGDEMTFREVYPSTSIISFSKVRQRQDAYAKSARWAAQYYDTTEEPTT